MYKKSQVSQVFTYLVAILVIGVIVVVGYKGIAELLKLNCEQKSVQFQKNIFGFIDEYSDRGSTYEEVLQAPCDIQEVCFADSRFCSQDPLERPSSIVAYTTDKVIISALEDSLECTANVFIKGKTTEALGFAEKLVLSEVQDSRGVKDYPFKCFKTRSGRFKFLFRGLGRKTQIEAG